MDATDWVERYAWFGVMENLQGVDTDNAMMNSNGQITQLGEQYIGEISAANDTDPTVSSSTNCRYATPPMALLVVLAFVALVA